MSPHNKKPRKTSGAKPSGTKRTTISIPLDLYEAAAKKAGAQKRTFSNYIEVAVTNDLNPTAA